MESGTNPNRNYNSNIQSYGKIKRFFLFSSGVTISILDKCPEESNKYASIGATIFFTAFLASLSGGYAFFFAFNSVETSILLGFFWGVIIYNLDRYIVMSLKKPVSEKWSIIVRETDSIKKRGLIYEKISSSLNLFLIALPRIIIAVIIALTVSKPIELRLFNQTIAHELLDMSNANISEFETNFKQNIEDLNNTLAKLSYSEAEEKEHVYGNNPVYQNKLDALGKLERDVVQINAQIQINEGIISENLVKKYVTESVPFPMPDGTIGSKLEKREVWDYNTTARKKKSENEELEVNKANLNEEINKIRADINLIEKDLSNEINNITESYKLQRLPISDQIESKKNSYLTDLNEWKKQTRETPDILTRLDALGNITNKKNEENEFMMAHWASLLITLLFISLETAPIIVKLLTKRGAYDELSDGLEYKYYLDQQEEISKINARVNSILQISKDYASKEGEQYIELEKQRLKVELENNQELLEYIGTRQITLAKKSVDQWYENELNKIGDN
jgi:hypothetical protein